MYSCLAQAVGTFHYYFTRFSALFNSSHYFFRIYPKICLFSFTIVIMLQDDISVLHTKTGGALVSSKSLVPALSLSSQLRQELNQRVTGGDDGGGDGGGGDDGGDDDGGDGGGDDDGGDGSGDGLWWW